MFWNRKIISYELRIMDAVDGLLAGDEKCLRITYEAFATSNKELIGKAGKAIGEYVSGRNTKQMMKVSEYFRQFTSLNWTIDWKNIDITAKRKWFYSQHDYQSTLILGSFHPNGYFRQRCIRELVNFPNTLVYLMLRTNDWVWEVCSEAYRWTLNKIEQCEILELIQAIQAVEKLRRSGRIRQEQFGEIETRFYSRMECNIKEIPLEKICFLEFDARKYVYTMLINRKMLTLEQIDMLLKNEKHSFCLRILIVGALKNYNCSDEQVNLYLENKIGIVRRWALEHKYKMLNNTWTGLENMLLDSMKTVRETTAYILKKHTDFCILDYYAAHLKDGNPIPAIVGLGENGGAKEAELLLPFLGADNIKIVRVTLEALGRIWGYQGSEIYLKYLQNKDVCIAKSAYKAIRYAEVMYGAECLYNICMKTSFVHVKRYALYLLMQENSWNRLSYLLDLYADEDFGAYQNNILAGICCRDMYGKISKVQAEQIMSKLQNSEGQLPEEVVKNILFDLKFVAKNECCQISCPPAK